MVSCTEIQNIVLIVSNRPIFSLGLQHILWRDMGFECVCISPDEMADMSMLEKIGLVILDVPRVFAEEVMPLLKQTKAKIVTIGWEDKLVATYSCRVEKEASCIVSSLKTLISTI